MTHYRTQIRQAFAERLLSETQAGTRVYPNFFGTMTTLPAINIGTPDDSLRPDLRSGDAEFRDVEVVVEIMVKATGKADEVADAIAKDVCLAVMTDPTFGAKIIDLDLKQVTTEMSDDLEANVVLLTLSYDALIKIRAIDPETFLS